jgi:hypothetical protein
MNSERFPPLPSRSTSAGQAQGSRRLHLGQVQVMMGEGDLLAMNMSDTLGYSRGSL